MAHLWIEEQPGTWAVVPLACARVALCDVPVVARPTDEGDETHPMGGDDGPLLVRDPARERSPWHLLAPERSRVWVNGLPLRAGFRAMSDRDQIRVDHGASLFFSTEELARVVPMPATSKPMMCPRCRQRIEPGTAAVCCPQCALWHHQSDDLPCWTYAPTCALCPQPSALDAGFQWTPEAL